ncbi:hypothetical protein Amet_1797 [Alkaliphilus metalliredigens QYMF]|uniref:HTH cro/C1-type domain-containing protein n=1 Tax=Alkaliphilus metalliredigens (strain QYMF) TaxID=293826 RepID=A6TP49_ALKMQ|nr:hypothetical protein Amet_1797 [Alkaliphilus metalliredigens QYMF]
MFLFPPPTLKTKSLWGTQPSISSIETGQFSPTAKLALILYIALDKKFEELFYFDEFNA